MLRIGSNGLALESVSSGCCDQVIDVTYRLSHITGSRAHGAARTTVVSVTVRDPSAFGPSHPAPTVGSTGTLALRDGVLSGPFLSGPYCDSSTARTGACGA